MARILLLTKNHFSSMRLRMALEASSIEGSIVSARDQFDLERAIAADESFQLVFVQGSLTDPITRKMIGTLREIGSPSEQTAIVLVTDELRRESFSIARTLIGHERVDGILLEPYSAEALAEVVALSLRTSRALQGPSMRRILRVLANELADQISLAAQSLKRSDPSKITRHVLQDISETVSSLPEQYKDEFIHFLHERCSMKEIHETIAVTDQLLHQKAA